MKPVTKHCVTLSMCCMKKFETATSLFGGGGEEFIIVLPGTSLAEAKLILDRITSDWLGPRPDGTPLTASIGVAERTLEKAETWKALLDLADARMYEAKQAGRARYVF